MGVAGLKSPLGLQALREVDTHGERARVIEGTSVGSDEGSARNFRGRGGEEAIKDQEAERRAGFRKKVFTQDTGS